MEELRVRNVTRDTLLAERARHARTLWQRTRGLLGTGSLSTGSGLVLEPCNSVHMLGMRYALDVVFADREGKVVGLTENLRPWRMTRMFRGARFAVELPVGTVAASGTQPGDALVFEGVTA